MIDSRKAYLFAAATILMWSTVATAFKVALGFLDIYQLIFYACLVSTLVLLVALAVRGELGRLGAVLASHWRLTLLSAVLNPFGYYLILFAAYDRLPAQVAQPINYTWAIVLTFLSIVVLGQRIKPRDILAAFICYSGVVIIALQGETSFSVPDFAGIGLALLSTVVWATYWILNIRDQREPTIALCLNFMVALPLAFAACVVMSDPIISWQAFAAAAWVGVFEMGLAFLCWSRALKLAENTSKVSNLIFLTPFLSLVFIHYFLGEAIYTTTLIGLSIIIAGLLVQRWRTGAT